MISLPAQTSERKKLDASSTAFALSQLSLREAEAIGKRRDPKPAIIVVDASAAQQANVSFYASGPVFLAETVPPRFLSLTQP